LIHRDLALHMEDSYVKNEVGLEQMIVRFRLALGLLASKSCHGQSKSRREAKLEIVADKPPQTPRPEPVRPSPMGTEGRTASGEDKKS